MDFTKIYNGMIGKDFIKAFNDNFTISDETFVSILATLIYKIKSTDIKEFRVVDNVVQYTLEEEPSEGEDTREWHPVDITKWGNIAGDINDQVDLKTILDDKAAVDTVTTLSNLLSTLSANFETLKNDVENDELNIDRHTSRITDLEDAIKTKVDSANIKALRLNNSVFQWSPDGLTWYEQPTVTSIAWGKLTGDITKQEDLMAKFTEINTSIESINSSVTALQNSLDSLTSKVDNIDTTLSSHITTTSDKFNTIDNTLNDYKSRIETVETSTETTANSLSNHVNDFDNPHHITTATIGLDKVDNTHDVDKPMSTATKNYIDKQIESIAEGAFEGLSILEKDGYVNRLFVGTQKRYEESIYSSKGMIAFIFDDKYFNINVTLTSQNFNQIFMKENGTKMIPTSYESETAPYYYRFADLNVNNEYTLGVIYNDVEYEAAAELDFTEDNEFSVDKYFINILTNTTSEESDS